MQLRKAMLVLLVFTALALGEGAGVQKLRGERRQPDEEDSPFDAPVRAQELGHDAPVPPAYLGQPNRRNALAFARRLHEQLRVKGSARLHRENAILKSKMRKLQSEVRVLEKKLASADEQRVRDAAELKFLRSLHLNGDVDDQQMTEDQRQDEEQEADEENPDSQMYRDVPQADVEVSSEPHVHQHAKAGLIAHTHKHRREAVQDMEAAENQVDASSDSSADSYADASSGTDANFPIVGTMAGLYHRFENEMPSLSSSWTQNNEVKSMQEESRTAVNTAVVEANLQQAREMLGRSEEERQHLQDRISDLEGQVSDKDAEIHSTAEKAQQAQEAEAAEAQKASQALEDAQQAAGAANATTALSKKLEDQQEEEASEKAALESQLQQKDKEEQALSEKLQTQQTEKQHQEADVKKLESELHFQLKGEGKFAAQKFESEREHEEDTLRSEASELQNMEGAEGKCMAWGKRLEGKLQHVLVNRKNDARLCRDGILSLHEERSKLRESLKKKELEMQKVKKEQSAAESSSTEDQQLLSKCLDEMQSLQR